MRHLVRGILPLFACIAISTQAFANCDNMSVVFPAPGATGVPRNFANTVELEWTTQVAAGSYDIYFGPLGAGCIAPFPHGTIAAPATQWSPPANEISPGTTYEWMAVARDGGVSGCAPPPNTSCNTFTTASEADCSNEPPALISPAANATLSGAVTFQWTARDGATLYQLFIQHGNGARRLVTTTANTQYTTSDLEKGANTWSVTAVYPECPDSTSADRSLNVEGGDVSCPSNPGRATLLSPANGATNLASPVTFHWNAVPNATSYRVLASFGDSEPFSLGTTTTTTLSADVPTGSGNWLVQTVFGAECPTTLSDRRNLTVTTGATCNKAAPQLVTPSNGATNVGSPVTFQWTAAAKATSYRLFVALGTRGFELYGETTGTSLQRLVPAGLVKWFVIADFAACPDTRSDTFSFSGTTFDDCAAATISLTSPSEHATTGSPVHMAWSPVAGALFYRVWASVNGSAPVNILRTNSTEADVNLPAGAITWYVDAPRENCSAVVSGERHFTIARGANCDNPAPVLVSPIGTRENPGAAQSHVTLIWNAVPNAIGYRIWISSDLVLFEDVTLTKLTQAELDLEPGTYAWFAEAFFDACPPVPSGKAFFRIGETAPRCPTGKPNVISPADGTVTASPITFLWSAVDKATKYRFFASINGSEPQVIGVTTETGLTRSLPPGLVNWRVEAVFEKCPSTFSDRVNFRVQSAQNCGQDGADLVSPANNATNVRPPVDFVWSAVSGAVKYVLVVQVNDGAPTAIAITTDTHLTRTVPAGTIRWHVVTFFSGCEPQESEHFRFTIARQQGCENRKPILILPADDDRALPSPVHFQWTAVPGAGLYLLWARQGDDDPGIIASTEEPQAKVELGEGRYEYFVEAHFDDGVCPAVQSAHGEFEVTAPVPCGKPLQPQAQVIGQALSNTEYRLRWTPLPNVDLYEVQEAKLQDFSDATTTTTTSLSAAFLHEVTGTPVQYRYRVRGVSNCGTGIRGPYSAVVSVFIIAAKTNNASAEIGLTSAVVQKVFVPGQTAPVQFTATSDKPWLTITPSSGTLPVAGITLTVTADPDVLSLGTNTGTIQVVTTGGSAKGLETEANTTLKIPLSVSLVTPVEPSGKGTPPPDSLIFPVVGHAQGANDSLFESDIRVTNLAAETARYEVNFTPTNTDGTQTGSSSTIEIAPNATMALDDIVASLFGTGTTSSAIGMLEVRPLATTSSSGVGFFGSTGTAGTIRELATAASSRTYNFTPQGTFGQYIPAVRFADFVGRAIDGAASSILSLQQVAESADFRANFGFAEAAGAPVQLSVRVYDTASNLLKTIPVSLKAGEHQQLNGMLALNGVTNLANGRVEVEVLSGDGKVTAYVSEVDNKTNDPLLVSAVLKGGITSNKWVVPGVAYINNPTAFWVTDMRVFNAGTAAVTSTLTFYAEREPSVSLSKQFTLQPGEIKVLDNVIAEHFAALGRPTGSIAVTTPSTTNLIVTARTYNRTTNGTYGQFVPGVTPAESVGASDRALQLLQLEQSPRLRTNIGLLETSGQPATIEVSAVIPDSLVTPVITYDLQPNEFRQISLADFAGGQALYNTRVTVKVINGAGRVTAYGSAIDELKGDPTYVPAQ
jgi:Viral BACON domain